MSKGDKTAYDSLKGTEIEEFWYLFDEYEKSIKPQQNG